MTPLEKATQAQRMAADPSGSRLAAANAGSGKTRVLVSRVSRLLLRGADPSDILCLTYTRAAAAEMQQRLFKTLGGWSVMDGADLREDLTELFGQPLETLNPPVQLGEARELFASALETPEGLKVQTIHAFCEKILSRFPIEAGIMPGFEPLDDTEILELRQAVETQILREAMAEPDGPLAQGLRVLTLAKADITLEGIFSWIAHSPQKVEAWLKEDTAKLADRLDLGSLRTAEGIAQDFWNGIDPDELDHVIEGLQGSTGTRDNKRGQLLATLKPITILSKRFEAAHSVFMTKDNVITKQLTAKSTPTRAKFFLQTEAIRYERACQSLSALAIFELTTAVRHIAARYTELYAKAKHAARGLDYSDQILFTRRLLARSETADWVRYKLDGGIHHILLDEAQDTAPEQWDIINILAEPFFQPSPDQDPNKPRTLFAVGDEKQSIYGFQGAKPERFLDEIRRRSDHAVSDIRMNMSFRSAQAVLDVVDSFLTDCGGMQAMFDAETFAPASDIIRHVANRTDAGSVELWPITPAPEKPEENAPWDTTPVDALGEGHQTEILAREIAAEIKGWVKGRVPIFDRDTGKTRPTRYADVLILVRRRGDLFEAIIRQCKRQNLPVAGADRLKLSEAIIVKDLLSLTRFCLLPSDDFSLAEVLKSPIIGYDDTDLMRVAMDRTGKLFDALMAVDPNAADFLQDVIALSQSLTPFDFYARFLDLKFQGVTIRQRFFTRLSMEARDALEAFLDQALAHQSRMAPNLQTFLRAFSNGDVEIKREAETARSEVRVMTVHGAKGLEAPVVILPDTTSIPSERDQLLPDGKHAYIWKPASAGMVPHVSALSEAAAARTAQEQLRLLYVAMTRAESRLIICGPQVGGAKAKLKEGCWYDWASRAMAALDTVKIPTPFDREIDGEVVTGLRYGADAQAFEEQRAPAPESEMQLPDWIAKTPPKEGRGRRVTPSHLLSDPSIDMAVRSPSVVKNAGRFRRGNLIHKLLEVLPEFPVARRREVAGKLLAGYPDLPDGLAETVTQEVFAVLENPEFGQVFAPGSRAEVSLAGSAKGLPEGLYLNAQIDRLCVNETDVFIVDYKSNRPPPTDPAEVTDLYLGQMAAYRELAREIYPGRRVSCALLWTDTPQLMVLPPMLLDDALRRVHALPISTL